MHVDGFRFDVGSILARGAGRRADGRPAGRSGSIELSETLADTKMIAEAWDAAGLYQVGYFPGLPLGRVERPLPRRRPPLRAGRRRAWSAPSPRASPAVADLYQAERPPADQQHQLHHLPRRLHAERPRLLQRQAQRGQRRGQPRRHRRQPELELRRRRADRRSGDRGAARPADQELRRDPDALAGRADARGRRRVPPHAAAATTTPTARTTRSAGSTGRCRSRTPTCSASSSR